MHPRAKEIIEQLNLVQHPEGGFYTETFRSNKKVGDLNLVTSIYFLLTSESCSNFHRIASDEMWFFHEGSTLTVHTLDNNGHGTFALGLNLDLGQRPYYLVPGNTIFGSSIEEKDAYALVSCVVAPGFDFETFQLFKRADLMALYPNSSEIIERLTRE